MELERPVEFLLVGPVGSLHLPVVLRGPRLDELVGDPFGFAEAVERVRALPVGGLLPVLREGAVGEFRPVVRLDERRLVAEEGDGAGQPGDGLVHGVLRGEVQVPFPGGLVEVRVLVEAALKARSLALA